MADYGFFGEGMDGYAHYIAFEDSLSKEEKQFEELFEEDIDFDFGVDEDDDDDVDEDFDD